jgi:hypothetical protein
MTERQVRITGVQKIEPCDEPGSFYCGPERTDIQLEAVNCTLEEFYEWFLKTKAGEDFCISDRSLIEIGGTQLELTVGNLISVSFNDVFNEIIESSARKAKYEISQLFET